MLTLTCSVCQCYVAVKANKSGRQHAVRHFHGREILGVEFLRSTEHKNGNNADSAIGEGHLTVAEYQPYKLDILQDKDDVDYVNYVVINEFHQKFLPAIMEIQRQKVIGVGADGIGGVYLERLCWLQIATKNRVFLFDILALGALAFKNGLTKILANDRILKVVHDCRRVAACLIALYEVKLMNVFDTQVADFLHFYRQTGGLFPDRVSTMQEVVTLHLGMSASHLSSLNIKSRLSKEDCEVWYIRPCPEPLLKLMALSVIHLLPLRLVLLDALMSDYTSLVDTYLASVLYQPVQTHDIGQDSCLELPRELCELEQLQQERQAWAMEYYPSTREGRLLRFMPRSTSTTSAEATSVSSSHSHTSHDDSANPTPAGLTEALHDPTPPSGSPTPTPTPYTTPLSHTPTSDTPSPDSSASHTPTPYLLTRHTPTPLTPTPHWLTPDMLTPHTLTHHTPTPHTLPLYTPTPQVSSIRTPTDCAPTLDSTEIPTSPPTPLLTLPTRQADSSPVLNPAVEAVPLYLSNQSQGSESPSSLQSILTMKPRALSTGPPRTAAQSPKLSKMEALPKQWPQTFPTENSAYSSPPSSLLEVVMDTMSQSNPTATPAEGAGQSSISSLFSLGRGLQLQRAALSNQMQHTGTTPSSLTIEMPGSRRSAYALDGDDTLRPLAAMAGVAQKIGGGKPSPASSCSRKPSSVLPVGNDKPSTTPPVASGKATTAPPLGKEVVLQKGPVRPSALSLAFSSFRMAS